MRTYATGGGRVLCVIGMGDVKLAAQQLSIAVAGPARWNRILRAPIEKSGNFVFPTPSRTPKRLSQEALVGS
jgi:hypothetical protein